jgi:HPt (histidine-containing phosphotransfer) domain-containing protein
VQVLDGEIVESIRSLADEGPAVLAELVRLYRESVDEKLAFLREAHRQRNGKALGDCAHAFGGSAASFGGRELRALCLRLEQQARRASWEAAAGTLGEVVAACARLEKELRRAGLWV